MKILIFTLFLCYCTAVQIATIRHGTLFFKGAARYVLRDLLGCHFHFENSMSVEIDGPHLKSFAILSSRTSLPTIENGDVLRLSGLNAQSPDDMEGLGELAYTLISMYEGLAFANQLAGSSGMECVNGKLEPATNSDGRNLICYSYTKRRDRFMSDFTLHILSPNFQVPTRSPHLIFHNMGNVYHYVGSRNPGTLTRVSKGSCFTYEIGPYKRGGFPLKTAKEYYHMGPYVKVEDPDLYWEGDHLIRTFKGRNVSDEFIAEAMKMNAGARKLNEIQGPILPNRTIGHVLPYGHNRRKKRSSDYQYNYKDLDLGGHCTDKTYSQACFIVCGGIGVASTSNCNDYNTHYFRHLASRIDSVEETTNKNADIANGNTQRTIRNFKAVSKVFEKLDDLQKALLNATKYELDVLFEGDRKLENEIKEDFNKVNVDIYELRDGLVKVAQEEEDVGKNLVDNEALMNELNHNISEVNFKNINFTNLEEESDRRFEVFKNETDRLGNLEGRFDYSYQNETHVEDKEEEFFDTFDWRHGAIIAGIVVIAIILTVLICCCLKKSV